MSQAGFPDGTYIAHRGSQWQRANNRNTNGVLRQ